MNNAPYWPPIDKKALVQGRTPFKAAPEDLSAWTPLGPHILKNGDLQDTTSGQQQVSGEFFPPRLGLPHEVGPQASRAQDLDPGVPRLP